MSSIAATPPLGRSNPDASRIGLAVLFLIFCYTLLSWRAMMLSDVAPIVSERRLIALVVGAGLFWAALKRLDSSERVTLARVASWIVGGTAVVLSARVFLDWMMPADELTVSYAVRWSLAWGAYFGLWIMGAISFRRQQVRRIAAVETSAVATVATVETATFAARSDARTADEVEWVIDALIPEWERLDGSTRHAMAERILAKAGRYELASEQDAWSAQHNARLRLAERVAGQLRAR